MVTVKPWGTSTRKHLDAVSQVEEVLVLPGGYSSIHLHRRKWNCFVGISGKLNVLQFDESLDVRQQHTLDAGSSLSIPPGVRHQFFAATKVEAVELYWGPDLDPNDIERFSENGRTSDLSEYGAVDEHALCSVCNRHATEKELVPWNGAMRPVCPSCRAKLSTRSR